MPTLGSEPKEQHLTDGVDDFRIDVPEAELEDLRTRLRNARWPETETVED
jgi:Epoxide hydrolase N terminus